MTALLLSVVLTAGSTGPTMIEDDYAKALAEAKKKAGGK